MFERFTDRARRVVVLAQEEARMLNHNYIGTEHILLGLIREGDGVGAQVLVKLGAELTVVRQKVIQLLSGYQGKTISGEVIADGPVKRKMTLLEAEIRLTRLRKESAIDDQDFDKAASLRDDEKKLVAQHHELEKGAPPEPLQQMQAQKRAEGEKAVNEILIIGELLSRHGVNPDPKLVTDLFSWKAGSGG